MQTASEAKTIATNRKARHNYFILETYEAGIELVGTEAKSIRAGHVNLKDSFCQVKNGEMYIYQMHVSPYEQGNIFNKDPMRPRKLLLHRREIMKLYAQVKQDGYTLIPLSIYSKNSRLKLEIGIARGKKLYDKRATMAERDTKREMERVMKKQTRNF